VSAAFNSDCEPVAVCFIEQIDRDVLPIVGQATVFKPTVVNCLEREDILRCFTMLEPQTLDLKQDQSPRKFSMGAER
jgi:hypothetical protein